MGDVSTNYFFFLRSNTHYHYGSSSKGNPRLLQLPSRQPESIPFLAAVYTGRSEVTLVLYISTCLIVTAALAALVQRLCCQPGSAGRLRNDFSAGTYSMFLRKVGNRYWVRLNLGRN